MILPPFLLDPIYLYRIQIYSMPQFTLDDFSGGNIHLHKVVCTGGKCRIGQTVHLQKSATESHDAILHGLNRRVGKLFFGVEPFEPTVDAWNDTLS